MNNRTSILNHRQITQRIRRMAWQIYEDNIDEKVLVIAGIKPRGYILAEKIAEYLHGIAPHEIRMVALEMDKDNPLQSEVKVEGEAKNFKNRVVIVIDDVLNTGSTLMYGLKPFLDKGVKKIQTAVMVDRSHKKYPVKADYKGLVLSTTMQEHIHVDLESKTYSAELS